MIECCTLSNDGASLMQRSERGASDDQMPSPLPAGISRPAKGGEVSLFWRGLTR